MDDVKFNLLSAVHYHQTDPGTVWVKDPKPAIDVNPMARSSGALTPNVIRLPDGGYRMYYLGFAEGFTKEDHSGHIISAYSIDGESWETDTGVRVDVHPPYATQRALCPDVVPKPEGGYRMYYSARVADRKTDGPSSPDLPPGSFHEVILSATSTDTLKWEFEEGVRLRHNAFVIGTPRCVYFPTKNGLLYRLYFHHWPYPLLPIPYKRTTIGTAISSDGLNFELEHGCGDCVIPQETERESDAVSAPDVIRLGDGSYRMYYAGWSSDIEGGIFTAVSKDGVDWTKSPEVLIDLDTPLDSGMISEPCVIELPDGRSRMFYEAKDEYRDNRILSATTP